MKALFFHEHGDADVLMYGDAPEPQAAALECVVRLRAAALNHLDVWVRRGWPGLKLALPHIGGADGAGEIVAVGTEVEEFREGMRVAICPGFATGDDEFTRRGEAPLSPSYRILGEHTTGTFAEYIAVPASVLVQMPASAEFTETAAAQLVFLTAWQMLVTQAGLERGETVLLVGTGGGVNTAALQIAKQIDASVIALTSSDRKMNQARELGADHVLDYNAGDWVKKIKELTNRRGADIVVDNVGQATLQKSLEAACRGGRIVIVGNTTGPKAEIDIRYIFSKQLRVIGSTMGTLKEFRSVMQLVWRDELQPIIDRVLPLSDGGEAHKVMERGEQFGKIVLAI